jgi:hypothetical protein
VSNLPQIISIKTSKQVLDKSNLRENNKRLREEEKEKSNWFWQNKMKLLKGAIVLFGLSFIVYISYKSYQMNKSLQIKKREMKEYAKQMEKIIEGSNNLVFLTWKDQKEGILFTENPAYKSKNRGDLSKAQQIQSEIGKVQTEIDRKNAEIKKLMEKERVFNAEIDKLQNEYENSKKKALDEGAALGFAGPVLREFV